MKQEREKSLLYTPFQEINKVNSPPFQGIIGSKDSKKLLLCPDYFIKAGQVSIFQNSFAVQTHIFHRKFAVQMKFFRRNIAEFCDNFSCTIWNFVIFLQKNIGIL
jgi:hypothetical protein